MVVSVFTAQRIAVYNTVASPGTIIVRETIVEVGYTAMVVGLLALARSYEEEQLNLISREKRCRNSC